MWVMCTDDDAKATIFSSIIIHSYIMYMTSLQDRVSRLETQLHDRRQDKRWIRSIPTLHATLLSLGKRIHGHKNTVPARAGNDRLDANRLMEHIKRVEKELGTVTTRLEILEKQLEEFTCCVCMTRKRDTCLMPCRHASFCHECVRDLMKTGNLTCPICRQKVQSSLRLN